MRTWVDSRMTAGCAAWSERCVVEACEGSQVGREGGQVLKRCMAEVARHTDQACLDRPYLVGQDFHLLLHAHELGQQVQRVIHGDGA